MGGDLARESSQVELGVCTHSCCLVDWGQSVMHRLESDGAQVDWGQSDIMY